MSTVEKEEGTQNNMNKEGTKKSMTTEEKRAELDARARKGETVVPGGKGGKSLEAQEKLAEGRRRGGITRMGQLGTVGYQEMGSRGGLTRKGQLGREGYQEMGRKGGLSSYDKSGTELADEQGIEKFKSPSKRIRSLCDDEYG